MPSSVQTGMFTLSTPIPYRDATTHFSAERSTFSVTCAKQNMMASTSVARLARVSSEASGATTSSNPASSSTLRSGSRLGQT